MNADQKIKSLHSIITQYESAKNKLEVEQEELERMRGEYEHFKSVKVVDTRFQEPETYINWEITIRDPKGNIIQPRIGDSEDLELYNLISGYWLKRIETQEKIVKKYDQRFEEVKARIEKEY